MPYWPPHPECPWVPSPPCWAPGAQFETHGGFFEALLAPALCTPPNGEMQPNIMSECVYVCVCARACGWPSGSCQAQGTAVTRVIFEHAEMENSGHPSILFISVCAWINTNSQYPAKINLRNSFPPKGLQAKAMGTPK